MFNSHTNAPTAITNGVTRHHEGVRTAATERTARGSRAKLHNDATASNTDSATTPHPTNARRDPSTGIGATNRSPSSALNTPRSPRKPSTPSPTPTTAGIPFSTTPTTAVRAALTPNIRSEASRRSRTSEDNRPTVSSNTSTGAATHASIIVSGPRSGGA